MTHPPSRPIAPARRGLLAGRLWLRVLILVVIALTYLALRHATPQGSTSIIVAVSGIVLGVVMIAYSLGRYVERQCWLREHELRILASAVDHAQPPSKPIVPLESP
jgi:hypothetical protein